MHKPVGEMLRRNPQGGPVLHQGHIVDVGHLGTADPLIDPTHHIAKDRLAGIVQLALHFFTRQVAPDHQRRRQKVAARGLFAALQLLLNRKHIDLVVMRGMQRGRRRRRHPCCIGTRKRMADLDLEHFGHGIGLGPHALADLSLAGHPGGKPGIDIAGLIGGQPDRALHLAFGDDRPGLH